MRNKSMSIDRNRKAIAGLAEHYEPHKTIVLDGVPHKIADVVKILQDQIDAADATEKARVSFRHSVAAEKAASAMANAVFLALKARVFSDFKSTAEVLASFGLTPPSRRKPDAETMAKAVAKREATRKARHTMGPRQRASITGETPATTPTPGHA